MATTVIHDACLAGALQGMLSGRNQVIATVAGYAALIADAKAIADEFITVNAASGAAIADGDKASIGPVVQEIASGVVSGRGVTSSTATDYVKYATDIYNIAKEAIAAGGLT